jgi:hypothetical protein
MLLALLRKLVRRLRGSNVRALKPQLFIRTDYFRSWERFQRVENGSRIEIGDGRCFVNGESVTLNPRPNWSWKIEAA